MKIRIILIGLLTVISPLTAVAGTSAEIDNIVTKAIDAYEKVKDYTCLFDKKELVRGSIIIEKNILFKYRKPSSVYMKWTEGKNEGREAIYVKGRYDDELRVHPGGILSFLDVSIDPYGKRAMKDNRHPITEAGIGFVLEVISNNYQKARSDRESVISIAGRESSSDGNFVLIEATLPPNKGYYAHIIRITIDTGINLPVGITAVGWNGELIEEYRFKDIKINQGLSEMDFDIKNPDYGF